MTKEEISAKLQQDRWFLSRNEAKPFLSLFDEYLSFLTPQYTLTKEQKIYHLRNNNYELHLCICGKLAVFSDGKYRTCSSECAKKKIKATNKEKFGSESFMASDYYKNKFKQTNLEKYGVEHPMQSDSYKEKRKSDFKEKFGVDNTMKLQSSIDAYKNTCSERYGADNYFKTEEFKEKAKETNIEKYGVENPGQSVELREKAKLTNIKKFGFDIVSKSEECKQKSRETNLEKYGVDHYSKSKYHQDRYRNIFEIPEGYELINYKMGGLILLHIFCNREFLINKSTYNQRKKIHDTTLCTLCNPIDGHTSGKELQLLEFVVSSCSGEVMSNTKSIIKPYELDIYLPDLKLAFEFNGNYWHSSKHKTTFSHKNKSDLCDEQGIKLLHIWEYDWMNHKEIIKSIISGYLGKHDVIHARKCELKEITAKDCREFINHNHLQGFVGATVYLGLYFENELMSVMSFIKNSDCWEIQRLCTKLNFKVVGGTEKMFKYFIKKYNPEVIKTFSNI